MLRINLNSISNEVLRTGRPAFSKKLQSHFSSTVFWGPTALLVSNISFSTGCGVFGLIFLAGEPFSSLKQLSYCVAFLRCEVSRNIRIQIPWYLSFQTLGAQKTWSSCQCYQFMNSNVFRGQLSPKKGMISCPQSRLPRFFTDNIRQEFLSCSKRSFKWCHSRKKWFFEAKGGTSRCTQGRKSVYFGLSVFH